MVRPSIVEVVGQYVPLRQTGREYSGCCPFHLEKSPSFSVNEEKGLFHCFGCHEGGDVIRFIEKIEGVDFKGALVHLGLSDQPVPTREKIKKRKFLRQASRNLATWALSVSERISTRMRQVGQRAYMAQTILKDFPAEVDKEVTRDEIARASREWEILTIFQEDLLNPETVMDLWREREVIERIVGDKDLYTPEELEGVFPQLTDEYRLRIKSYVEGGAT